MPQERIEFRVSPGNATERALIEALDGLGDEYGAKGRFLKERLLKGYTAIQRELDGFMRDEDPLGALERFASEVDAKHYRVLKVLLRSRMGLPDVSGGKEPRSPRVPPAKAGPASTAHAVPVGEAMAAPPEQARPTETVRAEVQANLSATPQDDKLSAPEMPAVSGTPVADDGQGAVGTHASAAPADPVPSPVPKHDWSRFKHIAGGKKVN